MLLLFLASAMGEPAHLGNQGAMKSKLLTKLESLMNRLDEHPMNREERSMWHNEPDYGAFAEPDLTVWADEEHTRKARSAGEVDTWVPSTVAIATTSSRPKKCGDLPDNDTRKLACDLCQFQDSQRVYKFTGTFARLANNVESKLRTYIEDTGATVWLASLGSKTCVAGVGGTATWAETKKIARTLGFGDASKIELDKANTTMLAVGANYKITASDWEFSHWALLSVDKQVIQMKLVGSETLSESMQLRDGSGITIDKAYVRFSLSKGVVSADVVEYKDKEEGAGGKWMRMYPKTKEGCAALCPGSTYISWAKYANKICKCHSDTDGFQTFTHSLVAVYKINPEYTYGRLGAAGHVATSQGTEISQLTDKKTLAECKRACDASDSCMSFASQEGTTAGNCYLYEGEFAGDEATEAHSGQMTTYYRKTVVVDSMTLEPSFTSTNDGVTNRYHLKSQNLLDSTVMAFTWMNGDPEGEAWEDKVPKALADKTFN